MALIENLKTNFLDSSELYDKYLVWRICLNLRCVVISVFYIQDWITLRITLLLSNFVNFKK